MIFFMNSYDLNIIITDNEIILAQTSIATLIAPSSRDLAVAKASAAASIGKRWVINALGNSGVEARIFEANSKSRWPCVFPYVMDGISDTSFIPIDIPGNSVGFQ